MLGRCGDLAALPGRALFYRGRWRDHLNAARAIGEAAVREGRMPADALGGFVAGAQESAAHYERMWTLNADIATQAIPLCHVLARRRWTSRGGAVAINHAGDLSETNALLARIRAAGAEQERLQSAARTGARADFEALAR